MGKSNSGPWDWESRLLEFVVYILQCQFLSVKALCIDFLQVISPLIQAGKRVLLVDLLKESREQRAAGPGVIEPLNECQQPPTSRLLDR